MNSKKDKIAKIMHHTITPLAVQYLLRKRFIVFNYHRIWPNDKGFFTPFDSGVYGVTIGEFVRQMKWLKSHTKVLSEKELIDIIHNDKVPPLYLGVLITFDDGYRDNYTLAYPVLKQLGLEAIFFVSTHLINTRQLGWWDIISYMIKMTKKHEIEFEGKKFIVRDSSRETIAYFQQRVKSKEQKDTSELLKKLAEICEVSFPGSAEADSQLMNWDEIRQLSSNNMAVGSHTHTHRILSVLDRTSQQDEMVLSKSILEKETGREIESIAYPVGSYQHFTPETEDLVRKCGYKLGFSFLTGVNNWRTIAPYNIKRLSGQQNVCLQSFSMIHPKLFIK